MDVSSGLRVANSHNVENLKNSLKEKVKCALHQRLDKNLNDNFKSLENKLLISSNSKPALNQHEVVIIFNSKF